MSSLQRDAVLGATNQWVMSIDDIYPRLLANMSEAEHFRFTTMIALPAQDAEELIALSLPMDVDTGEFVTLEELLRKKFGEVEEEEWGVQAGEWDEPEEEEGAGEMGAGEESGGGGDGSNVEGLESGMAWEVDEDGDSVMSDVDDEQGAEMGDGDHVVATNKQDDDASSGSNSTASPESHQPSNPSSPPTTSNPTTTKTTPPTTSSPQDCRAPTQEEIFASLPPFSLATPPTEPTTAEMLLSYLFARRDLLDTARHARDVARQRRAEMHRPLRWPGRRRQPVGRPSLLRNEVMPENVVEDGGEDVDEEWSGRGGKRAFGWGA